MPKRRSTKAGRKPKRQRARRVWISVLNVKAEPHELVRYRELFLMAHAQPKPVRYFGDRSAIIGSLSDIDRKLFGEVFTFSKINVRGAWLDLLKKKQASEEDIEKNVSIPEHLMPHYKKFAFVFFPEDHRLVVDATTTSARTSRYVVELLLNKARTSLKGIGTVEIDIEQDAGQLDKFWKLKRIDWLRIRISRPNPTDLSSLEGKFKKRLQEQAAGTWIEELEADQDESGLKPNRDTKAAATVAASNGGVDISGRGDNNRRVKDSTEDHPIRQQQIWDPNRETFFQFLDKIGTKIVQGIVKRLQKK